MSVTVTYQSRNVTGGRRNITPGVYIYPSVTLPVTTCNQSQSRNHPSSTPAQPTPIPIAQPTSTERSA